MAWVYLLLAGLLETVWAVGLKWSDGFSRIGPSIFTVVSMIASFWLLAVALRSLPLGTAYAVWTGIGATCTAIIGIAFLGESKDVLRLFCLGLIVAGIVGLKLVTTK